jgi:hypothetical protein
MRIDRRSPVGFALGWLLIALSIEVDGTSSSSELDELELKVSENYGARDGESGARDGEI